MTDTSNLRGWYSMPMSLLNAYAVIGLRPLLEFPIFPTDVLTLQKGNTVYKILHPGQLVCAFVGATSQIALLEACLSRKSSGWDECSRQYGGTERSGWWWSIGVEILKAALLIVRSVPSRLGHSPYPTHTWCAILVDGSILIKEQTAVHVVGRYGSLGTQGLDNNINNNYSS